MPGLIKTLLTLLIICALPTAAAQQSNQQSNQQPTPEEKTKPAFGERIANSPFVELYVLDELKLLRTEMAAQKNELLQQIVDREINSIDRGVSYATSTVSNFFYLIAAASSVLVIVGWTSIRDIKERVHHLADQEISKLVNEYESRLRKIEKQLNQKTLEIEENREEIALTQDIHSLWLRAGQDSNPQSKIAIYDQILSLHENDTEALTYKADAVLELDEPQWAANLCHQALAIDPENSHAFYQLGCAHAVMKQPDEAVKYLTEAVQRGESYRADLATEPALVALKKYEPFQQLLGTDLQNDY